MVKRYIPASMKNNVSSEKIEGEHRHATVLFANISGFTALSGKFDSKRVTDITNNLFEVLREIVYEYKGTIGSFIGDCIMMLFGIPITHEDDPERAVYAALDMMSAMKRFNEEHGTNLLTHVGINSGVVIVCGVGSDSGVDYPVMGDTVNCADQLMEIAKNEVLVSESVYKNTAYLFEMDILKPISVKGKTASILPYRVVGMKEAPGHKRGVLDLYSPLIGRDKEFKVMQMVLDTVMKKKSMVISVNGEAGVGKSRLIGEFRKTTTDKANWLSGRCPSYGKGFPFWVFLEQIRSYLGVHDSDFELESRRKMGGKAESLFKERINDYLPYLCVFLSIKVLEHLQEKVKYLDPESLRLQEFVSVKALFRDIAKNKPLILYFEDIHWIDPESLELIKFLLDGLKDVSILFIFETRYEQETGLHNIKKSIQKVSKKRYREIGLNPLSTNNAKKLIRSLLKTPELPRDISSLILEKSECNPFYVVEIVRSFIESGILKRDNGSWKLTKDVSSFEIPNTIEAVIRSRIDNLPLEVKDVLGKASVIGRSFLYRILSYITEEDNLRKHLDYLEERGFILKKNGSSASRISPDTEYIFSHILIRDVAYKGLLKKKRKKTHKKVAECIENVFRERIEDLYEMLAYHYYHAEILKKSYNYYKKAGDAAKERYSNNIAIECYTKTIEIHKELFPENKKDKLAELFERRGDVREVKAEYDKALKDYENSFSYYKSIEKKAEIKRKIGKIFRRKSEYDNAISFYEEVIRMLEKVPESPILLSTLIGYANLFYEGKSDYVRAKTMVEHALKKLDKKKEKRIYAHGLKTLGAIFLLKGDYDRALKHLRKALAIDDQINDKKGIGLASGNIGIVYWYKGELDTALKYYKKYLTISEEIGDKRGTGKVSCNIGLVYKDKGELDTALKYYKRYLTISEEIGDKSGIGVASNNIGDVYHDKGELDTALKYYKRDLVISEETGDKSGIGVAYNNIGIVYHDKGELDTAEKYFEKYLTMSEEIGYKIGIGDGSGGIGVVYHDRGKFDTALKYYNKALTIFNEIGYKSGIGIVYLYIGDLYTADKKFVDAKEYLGGAEKILTKIGDKINLSKAYASLSHLNAVQEEYGSAITFAEKALSLAKETGAREKEVIALRVFGKALVGAFHETPKKAISYLKQSISLARKQNMQFQLAKSLYELAKILKNVKKVKESEKHIKEAKMIFKKSGANGWLKKLKALEDR